jgi:[citrate (pro-3S)-lyase] ligase
MNHFYYYELCEILSFVAAGKLAVLNSIEEESENYIQFFRKNHIDVINNENNQIQEKDLFFIYTIYSENGVNKIIDSGCEFILPIMEYSGQLPMQSLKERVAKLQGHFQNRTGKLILLSDQKTCDLFEELNFIPDFFINTSGFIESNTERVNPKPGVPRNAFFLIYTSVELGQLFEKLKYYQAFYFANDEKVHLPTVYLINKIGKLKRDKNVKVYYFNPPVLAAVKHPSENEKMIMDAFSKCTLYEFIGMLIEGKFHDSLVNHKLEYFTKDYMKEILHIPRLIQINQLKSLEDYESQYVNIKGGKRFTTDAPDQYKNIIHCFGSSQTYSFGVEDKYTFSSCLQRRVNKNYPDTYLVLNYGVVGYFACHMLKAMDNAQINEGDIIIFYTAIDSEYFFDFAVAADITTYNFQPMFQRPHNMGDVFIDTTHINHYGLEKLTEKAFKVMFTYKDILNDFSEIRTSKLNEPLNQITGNPEFANYLSYLAEEKIVDFNQKKIGSVVMNCNPFTLGHQYLIQFASESVDYLYIFLVEEDRSVFSFEDRYNMVKAGISKFDNVKLLRSGNFIISSITFPEYFTKETNKDVIIDPSLDLDIFGNCIAKALNISVRFAGEEPFDPITKQYNRFMENLLKKYDIKFVEIKRKEYLDSPISASRVRKLLKEGNLEEMKKMVPKTTYDYLLNCWKGLDSCHR